MSDNEQFIEAIYQLAEQLLAECEAYIDDHPIENLVSHRNAFISAQAALEGVGLSLPERCRWLISEIDRAIQGHQHWRCPQCLTVYPDDEGVCSVCDSTEPLEAMPAIA